MMWSIHNVESVFVRIYRFTHERSSSVCKSPLIPWNLVYNGCLHPCAGFTTTMTATVCHTTSRPCKSQKPYFRKKYVVVWSPVRFWTNLNHDPYSRFWNFTLRYNPFILLQLSPQNLWKGPKIVKPKASQFNYKLNQFWSPLRRRFRIAPDSTLLSIRFHFLMPPKIPLLSATLLMLLMALLVFLCF